MSPAYAVALRYYYFFYAAVAFAIALAATPLAGWLAARLGAVDRAGGRRLHRGAVPRLGGLGIAVAVLLPLAFLLTRGVPQTVHQRILAILACASIVLAAGVLDDVRRLPVAAKLAVEVGAAGLLWALGVRVEAITVPFAAGTWHPGLWSLPITVLWMVVVTNAVNLIDGLDGLAAGTAAMIAGTLFLVAGDREPHLRVAMIVLVGALVGFLRYNLPPASVFMGDSGSLFLGFTLGALAVVSYAKAAAMATVMLPVLAFGLPLLDMGYAVLRRFWRGQPLGTPDGEHIHHRLVALGLTQRAALAALTGVNAALMALALVFVARNARADLVVALLLAAGVLFGARLLGYAGDLRVTADGARNLFRLRRERYLHFLVRRLEAGAERARSRGELDDALAVFVRESGLRRLVLEGRGERELRSFGAEAGAGAAGEAVALVVPVSDPAGEVARARAEWDPERPMAVRADEGARVAAAAVETYLERRRELESPPERAGAAL